MYTIRRMPLWQRVLIVLGALALLALCAWGVYALANRPTGQTALEITSATLPQVTTGEPFDVQLQGKGGTPPYTWSKESGPDWVTVDADGHLKGTSPEGTAGTNVPVTVKVSDSAGGSTTKEVMLPVASAEAGETPVPGATPTTGPTEVAECPTDGQMQDALNFEEDVRPVFTGEGVSWDSCKWNWQSYATTQVITLTLPVDYVATLTLKSGEVQVWRGLAEVEDVAGFTLRYTPSYEAGHWVHDDCAFLAQEFAFGQRRDPAYITTSGNLSCTEPQPEVVDGTASTCPSSTEQVASLVGGTPNQWTAPDWSGGAWVFKSGGSFVTLSVPSVEGSNSWLDYWNGQKNAADRLEVGESLALSEASFHCEAASR